MTGPLPIIFDSALYRARRQKAARASDPGLFLAGDVAAQLAQRVATVNRRFANALYLNSREQGFDALAPLADEWTRTEHDEANLPVSPAAFDLIVSVLSLHAVNDLPGALVQIRRAMRPDGLFLAALFGGDTLNELRTAFAAAEAESSNGASPRVAPFADVRSLGGLLVRAGFALPLADVERTVVRYRDLSRLFADLRALGETNALAERRRSFLSRRVLAELFAQYRERYSDADGRHRATFDIVYLMGWAPHESQQVPLKPGSAKMRLADALTPKTSGGG